MGTCTFRAWSQTLVRIAVTSIRNSRLPPLVRPVLSPWKRSRAPARNKPSPLFLASDPPLPFQSSLRFATFVSFSLFLCVCICTYTCVIVYRIFHLCSTQTVSRRMRREHTAVQVIITSRNVFSCPGFSSLATRGGDDRSNYFVPSRTGGEVGKERWREFVGFLFISFFFFFSVWRGIYFGEERD